MVDLISHIYLITTLNLLVFIMNASKWDLFNGRLKPRMKIYEFEPKSMIIGLIFAVPRPWWVFYPHIIVVAGLIGLAGLITGARPRRFYIIDIACWNRCRERRVLQRIIGDTIGLWAASCRCNISGGGGGGTAVYWIFAGWHYYTENESFCPIVAENYKQMLHEAQLVLKNSTSSSESAINLCLIFYVEIQT